LTQNKIKMKDDPLHKKTKWLHIYCN